MPLHSHQFVENYDGPVAFGFDRETDENTVIVYLQKFSDDRLMEVLQKRMSDQELTDLFDMVSGLMQRHLEEPEYHALFLKEDGPE
jgi:hypothetical protein